MRKLIIHCDGGFGNRFNALVSGLLLCRLGGFKPVVAWPRNNWCGASCHDLITGDFEVVERELLTYVPEFDRLHHFMTEDHLTTGVTNLSPMALTRAPEALQWLNSSTKDVFFHTALIPHWLPIADVLGQLQLLQLNPTLVARAEALAKQHHLDSSFYGLHIRKTDFGTSSVNDEQLYTLVKEKAGAKFFVCSDDQEVEQRFGQMPGVVVNHKTAHVEKMVAGGWTATVKDSSGRLYPFNVLRNADSVMEAVVDLLLLARTQIVRTSHSTFLQTAVLWRAARFGLPPPEACRLGAAMAQRDNLAPFDT